LTNLPQGPSELLGLLDRRWKADLQGMSDAYRVAPRNKVLDERAARLHASAHHSDPFAYGRMKLHLARGLEDATTVANDALARIASHSGQTVGIIFPVAT
jgi:hypothetical protein